MGYRTTAEDKIWRRSLRRDVAYEGGDFFEVANWKGMEWHHGFNHSQISSENVFYTIQNECRLLLKDGALITNNTI